MKTELLLVLAAMMATTNVSAQLSDETQGVGGLVLDSLYTTGSNGVRSIKYVYEYTEAKQPKLKQELAYFDDNGASLEVPRLTGYETYTYDGQNRMKKIESYKDVNGAFRISYIEEIAEYDAETGLPAVIYAYQVDEEDPEATPVLTQKAVTTKYHGNIGLEDVDIYMMSEEEWTLMGTMHNDYDDNGLVVKEVMSLGAISMVTDYEHDEHRQVTKKVVKEQVEMNGMLFDLSSVEMTFTNDYYDDGNLKTSAEYDDGKFIETSYYFWGEGVMTAISRMSSVLEMADQYYDLNGSAKNGKPSRKGLYIHKGKIVIIK